jgi:hypothetical protein
MNKIFYAIYNKEENKFLSIYEDGEGNDYHTKVDFEEINRDAIFSKEDADFRLKQFTNMAGFYRFSGIDNPRDFALNLEIVPIEISTRFDLITEE